MEKMSGDNNNLVFLTQLKDEKEREETPSKCSTILFNNRIALVNNMRARDLFPHLIEDRLLSEITVCQIKETGKGTNKEMNEAILAELFSMGNEEFKQFILILRKSNLHMLGDLLEEGTNSKLMYIFEPISRKLGNHWRRVARQLQILEPIVMIEAKYPGRLRDQALYSLLAWEKEDQTATATRLINALKACGMKQAAAFAKSLLPGKVKKKTAHRTKKQLSGTLPVITVMSTSPKTNGTPRRSVGTPRKVSASLGKTPRKASSPSKRGHSRRKTKETEKLQNGDEKEFQISEEEKSRLERKIGGIKITVFVESVDLPMLSKKTKEEVASNFRNIIIKNPDYQRNLVESIRGIHSDDLVVGSVQSNFTIEINCKTLSGLEALWDKYCGEELLKMAQKTLVTDRVLYEIDAKKVVLSVSIDEKDYTMMRADLLTKAALGIGVSMSHHGSKKDIVAELKRQQFKYQLQLQDVLKEYNRIEANMSAFISALKRIKPPSVKKFSNLYIVSKYMEIFSSKTTDVKRPIETFLTCVSNLRGLEERTRNTILGNVLKIGSDLETEVQAKCKEKIASCLDEWNKLTSIETNLTHLNHAQSKMFAPTPDLICTRPILSLIPTLLELAGTVDKRLANYIKDDN